MSNPFEVNESEGTFFAQIEIETERMVKGSIPYDPNIHQDKKPYWQILVRLAPVTGGELREYKLFNFSYTPENTKIFLNSIARLTGNPSSLDGKYVKYHWEQWRDYSKNSINYYADQPDKLKFDQKGRQFVEKGAINVDAIYNDEKECQDAIDETFGVESDSAFNVSGTGNGVTGGQQQRETALGFLPALVKTCLDNGKVDRDQLGKLIANSDNVFGQEFGAEHPTVLAAISAAEKDQDISKAIETAEEIPF